MKGRAWIWVVIAIAVVIAVVMVARAKKKAKDAAIKAVSPLAPPKPGGTGATTAAGVSVDPNKVISNGSKGEEVAQFQRMLNAARLVQISKGYTPPAALTIDGAWGPKTQALVEMYYANPGKTSTTLAEAYQRAASTYPTIVGSAASAGGTSPGSTPGTSPAPGTSDAGDSAWWEWLALASPVGFLGWLGGQAYSGTTNP